MRWLNWLRSWWNRPKPTSLGEWGEQQASRYLRQQGYRLVVRNYRCPVGEIDLIVRINGLWVFVEVKTRVEGDRVDPTANVHPSKQRRLTRTAVYYLQHHRVTDPAVRFDVIAIVGQPGIEPTIDHYQAAFEAQGPWSL